MKVRELFDKKTVFSFEVFPPKKTSSIDTVYKTLEELEGLTPDFISVTFSAGGSGNSGMALDIASRIKEKIQGQLVGEVLAITGKVIGLEDTKDLEISVQTRVPSRPECVENGKALVIQVFRAPEASSFARSVPLVFYSSLDWGGIEVESTDRRGHGKAKKERRSSDHE